MNNSDSIIFVVNLNDNIVNGQAANALKRLGLIEVATAAHNHAPPTYHCGSKTIDGIFVTHEIIPKSCGYISTASDHLCVWLVLDMDNLFRDLSHLLALRRFVRYTGSKH
jgi:hypothetical protein